MLFENPYRNRVDDMSMTREMPAMAPSGVRRTSAYQVNQATKGKRWMPRQQEAMKDAGACEKPRGAGKHAMIRGCPNGVTQRYQRYPARDANAGN